MKIPALATWLTLLTLANEITSSFHGTGLCQSNWEQPTSSAKSLNFTSISTSPFIQRFLGQTEQKKIWNESCQHSKYSWIRKALNCHKQVSFYLTMHYHMCRILLITPTSAISVPANGALAWEMNFRNGWGAVFQSSNRHNSFTGTQVSKSAKHWEEDSLTIKIWLTSWS